MRRGVESGVRVGARRDGSGRAALPAVACFACLSPSAAGGLPSDGCAVFCAAFASSAVSPACACSAAGTAVLPLHGPVRVDGIMRRRLRGSRRERRHGGGHRGDDRVGGERLAGVGRLGGAVVRRLRFVGRLVLGGLVRRLDVVRAGLFGGLAVPMCRPAGPRCRLYPRRRRLPRRCRPSCRYSRQPAFCRSRPSWGSWRRACPLCPSYPSYPSWPFCRSCPRACPPRPGGHAAPAGPFDCRPAAVVAPSIAWAGRAGFRTARPSGTRTQRKAAARAEPRAWGQGGLTRRRARAETSSDIRLGLLQSPGQPGL